jgi:acetoacetyl-CoA synthetase
MTETGPAAQPLWQPPAERIRDSAMTAFQARVEATSGLQFDDYTALHQWSINEPAAFWQCVWEFCDVRASTAADEVVQDLDQFPGTCWFPGSRLNFAENLLRYRDDRIALIGLLENGQRQAITYAELHERVARLAAALRAQGIAHGDRIAGLMPNVPETVIAMLATASIGAIWSSCSPDFGIDGACDRFSQITPRLLFTTDAYRYNGRSIDCLDKAASIKAKIASIETVIVFPVLDQAAALKPGQVGITDFIDGAAEAPLTFEQLPFDHPLYIMYSSGTTGVPKCIVHGAGGTLLQHLKEHRLHVDLKRDDTLFYFTTCGWMMWNWLVSGLASGATLLLYDGSPFAQDGNVLLDAIDNEAITIFGTSAKFISALEKQGHEPARTHSLASLKTILSTGSPLSHSSFDYVYRSFKADVHLASISGGTDIISCFVLGNPNLPVYTGEIQCIGLGMAVAFHTDDGIADIGEAGELVCARPFPSVPLGFWQDDGDTRFLVAYFAQRPGHWTHGDYGEITRRGGIIIHGRSDATLNPSGVRIGTAEIYRQVETFAEIIDSIVVGQRWEDDERIVLFVVLAENCTLEAALVDDIKATIRARATPRHVPARIIAVPDIPRTISGKIVELAVKKVIHDEPVNNTDALANPEALDYFRDLEELRH